MTNSNNWRAGAVNGQIDGQRPSSNPQAQMAYDGARFNQQKADYLRKQNEQFQRDNARRRKSSEQSDDTDSLDDENAGGYLTLIGIGGFTFLLVAISNILLQVTPLGNGPIATVLKFSPWAVGAAGIYIGIRIQDLLTKITGIIVIATLLFFGSAIAYGLYQGMSGTG